MEISDIRKAIEGIKSVESCGIVTDENDHIEEIHIVADYNRSAKQISRDIQSLMISRFSVDIDHRKISIAQLRDVDLEKSAEFRLKLKTIEQSVSGSKSEVKVVLEKDDSEFEAMVSGNCTKFNTQRILSTATLKAIENFLEKDDIFTFEDVKVVNVADSDIAVVSVVIMESGQEKRLFGCSQIKRDLNEAVVRATLDAINRKVTQYLNL
jgi:hypothetical protein